MWLAFLPPVATEEPDADRRHELTQNIVDRHAENLYVIGTIGNVPRPMIANSNLGNVPAENLWAWDTLTGAHIDLEQMFFKDVE